MEVKEEEDEDVVALGYFVDSMTDICNVVQIASIEMNRTEAVLDAGIPGSA